MRRWIEIGITLAVSALLLGGLWQSNQQNMTQEIAQKVIRFHVRANSDAKADQELKLKVRDAVGAYMQPKLAGIFDIEMSRQTLKKSLSQIEETAAHVIAKEGYDYGVTAALTITDFPEKTYGDYTFPAGQYEALELVIGKGAGHNWWCVMYPNLCFFNSVYEVVDEEAERSLQQVLTKEEYQSLMEKKNYKVTSLLAERIREIFENH
ncbi:MAG: stage II sporulation protein R [Lachnospiraceae bacterium]|jgi:stage II sporulation protein R|nr:stage II sporulation protein R [Lachnospiraceae bacterium]